MLVAVKTTPGLGLVTSFQCQQQRRSGASSVWRLSRVENNMADGTNSSNPVVFFDITIGGQVRLNWIPDCYVRNSCVDLSHTFFCFLRRTWDDWKWNCLQMWCRKLPRISGTCFQRFLLPRDFFFLFFQTINQFYPEFYRSINGQPRRRMMSNWTYGEFIRTLHPLDHAIHVAVQPCILMLTLNNLFPGNFAPGSTGMSLALYQFYLHLKCVSLK